MEQFVWCLSEEQLLNEMTLTEVFGLVAILDPLYVGFTDECHRLQIRVTGCKNIRCFFSAEPTALEH